MAYAGDEEFECQKSVSHGHVVECKAKHDNVAVQSIEINGGGCESAVHSKIHHKVMKKGDKFEVPGSKECGYVASVIVHTHSGKTEHFYGM
jgi:hypothetical protein